jgi:hypothetical protein
MLESLSVRLYSGKDGGGLIVYGSASTLSELGHQLVAAPEALPQKSSSPERFRALPVRSVNGPYLSTLGFFVRFQVADLGDIPISLRLRRRTPLWARFLINVIVSLIFFVGLVTSAAFLLRAVL